MLCIFILAPIVLQDHISISTVQSSVLLGNELNRADRRDTHWNDD